MCASTANARVRARRNNMTSITRQPVKGCPGLYLRETASGQVFEGRLKHRGSSLRRKLEATSLRAAKAERAAWPTDLGRDVPEAQSRRSGLTFAEVYGLYVERLSAEGRTANTLTNAAYRFRHLKPLHRRPIASITRDEVVT